jgi:hypothetical protein
MINEPHIEDKGNDPENPFFDTGVVQGLSLLAISTITGC